MNRRGSTMRLAAGLRAGGEQDSHPASPGSLRPSREALRREAERLGKLAREDLVPDHEYQLQDVRLREVLPNPGKACVRDLSVIGDDFLSELEGGPFACCETVGRAPVGQRGQRRLVDVLLHADGVTYVELYVMS